MSIALKHVLAFLLVSLCPLFLLAGVLYHHLQTTLEQQTVESLQTLAQIQESRVRRILQGYLYQMTLVASRTRLRKDLELFNASPADATLQQTLQEILDDAVAPKDEIEGLAISGQSGKRIAGAPAGENTLVQDLDIPRDNIIFYDFVRNAEGHPLVKIATPLVGESERLGTLFAGFDARALYGLTLDYTGLGVTGETLLLRIGPEGTARFVGPARFDREAAFNRTLSPEEPEGALLRALGEKSSHLAERAIDYRGVEVIAEVRRIHPFDFAIIVKKDRQEVFKTIDELTGIFIVLVSGISLVVLIGAFWFSRTFSRPVLRLKRELSKLQTNGTGSTLDLTRKDELGDLNRAFVQLRTSLAENEERFRQAVESAPHAMIITDPEGRVTLINVEGERLFGYRRTEILGEPSDALLSPRYRGLEPGQQGLFVPTSSATPAERQEMFGRRKDGSEFPMEIGRTTIESGGRPMVLSSIVDITHRKRTEEELRFRHEEMEQLVYTVSHDLKSPLVTMSGFASLFKKFMDQNDREKANDAAERIKRAAVQMRTLIDDLLELSRVGRQAGTLEDVDVQNMFEDIKSSIQSELDASGATIEVEGTLPRIKTQRSALRSALLNLLTNAIQYGCPTKSSTITVGHRLDPLEHHFFVRDQGPGIDPKHHTRIFAPFQRLSKEGDGSGLGLAIVSRLIRSLGGRAWVTSTPGDGATFWIAVPRL